MEKFSNLDLIKAKYNKQSIVTKFIVRHEFENGCYFAVFKNVLEYSNYHKQYDNMHEIILPIVKRKFVVDIETKADDDSQLSTYLEHTEFIRKLINDLFLNVYNIILTKNNFVEINSCGIENEKYKYSINFVIDGYYFINYNEFQHFGNNLAELYYKEEKAIPNFLDTSFYNKQYNSSMSVRLVGHSKVGQNRPKKIVSNHNTLAGFLTYIENCKELKQKHEINKLPKIKHIDYGQEFDDYILDMTKHIWLAYFEFRQKKGNIYYFNLVNPAYCQICGEIHHKDNFLYFVLINGCLYQKCLQEKKTSLFITDVTLPKSEIAKNDKPIIEKKEIKINSYVNEHFYLSDNPNLEYDKMFPPNKDIYIIKAEMKMGKTKECIKFLANNDIKSAIIISFRKTFANDMKKRYKNFSLYSDIDGEIDLNQHPKLIIQIESMWRIKYPLPIIEVIILDEIESIWSQFSSTYFRDFYGSINAFEKLIKISKKIICMDANVSKRTFSLLPLIRTDFGLNYSYYKNIYNPSKDCKYYIISEFYRIIAIITKYVQKKKKIAIMTSSIKRSEQLKKYLSTFGISIGLYNSKTKESIKDKHFGDVNFYWAKYDCIICTPSVSAGVSFEKEHFDVVFGLFVSESCNTQTCRQMLGRIRNVKDNKIYLYLDEFTLDGKYSENPKTIRNQMKYKRQELIKIAENSYNLNFLPFQYDNYGNAEYFEHLAYYIISENIAYDNKSKNNFTNMFINYLDKFGYKIEYEDSLNITNNFINECKSKYNNDRELLEIDQSKKIYDSRDISKDESLLIYQKKQNNADVSNKEYNELVKYILSKYLKMELNEKIIRTYKPANLQNGKNLTYFIESKKLLEYDPKITIQKECDSMKKLLESHNFLKDAIFNYKSVSNEIIKKIFIDFPINYNIVDVFIGCNKLDFNYKKVTNDVDNLFIVEFWKSKIDDFATRIKNIMFYNNLTIPNNLEDMNHNSLLDEFIRCLKLIYGVKYESNRLFGFPEIIFVYQNEEYNKGKLLSKKHNFKLPKITINELFQSACD